ncbi:hypothetical protein [Enterococcus gallinarum]|uniref:hypothetical protein n=1 Tax=Enterococcus gallinarum TaxID=1353 RepID=UPI003D6B4ACC
MAKFKVLEQFRDKHTKELYEVGEEIELTVKRAKEAEKNLAKHGKIFIERIDDNQNENFETVEEDKK